MERLIQIVLINFLNEVPSNDVLERNPIQIFDIKLYICKHVLTGFTQTTPFFFFVFEDFYSKKTHECPSISFRTKQTWISIGASLIFLRYPIAVVFGPWNNFDPRLRVCHHPRKRRLHRERQLEHWHLWSIYL